MLSKFLKPQGSYITTIYYSLSSIVSLSIIQIQIPIRPSPLKCHQKRVRISPAIIGSQAWLLHRDNITSTNVELQNGEDSSNGVVSLGLLTQYHLCRSYKDQSLVRHSLTGIYSSGVSTVTWPWARTSSSVYQSYH